MIKYILTIITLTVVLTAVVSAEQRMVAITIDDLPVVSKIRDKKSLASITDRLLGHIVRSNAPVTGFVNEQKLFKDGKRIEFQIDFLRQWITSGCDLGNHTYSHLSLHSNDVQKFTGEILRGEIVTRELLAAHGKTIRYFRHPYLFTGLNMEVKREVSDFLEKHNYEIAPVSIDNSEWAFAAAYDNALIRKDTNLRKQIGKAYVPYLIAKTGYWEKQSKKLFGREIRQILLLHANSINAEYLDDVIESYKKRGYKLVSLEEALKDKAYKNPDTFVGRSGISWLHRWALERGKENLIPDEPRVPKFVMVAAGLKSE
jgi:peptidoglycan/xylan/chitin deacetylase (PgdA/CDA1 family)